MLSQGARTVGAVVWIRKFSTEERSGARGKLPIDSVMAVAAMASLSTVISPSVGGVSARPSLRSSKQMSSSNQSLAGIQFQVLIAQERYHSERSTLSGPVAQGDEVGRRQVLTGVATLAATLTLTTTSNSALAANAPKGFAAVLDNADGYAFYYPFGWQEVAVRGQDVAFKDVIEPLESVSVSIVKTDKTSLDEIGSPDEVARALVEKVLSSPTQKTTLKEAKARVTNGKTYYQFEFTAQAKNFTRHALGAVAVNGGKFYTLTTGANERRWGKIEDKLRQVVESFTTL